MLVLIYIHLFKCVVTDGVAAAVAFGLGHFILRVKT